ncbi:MAG: DUF4388 domain-containing protein [Planctomycetes bacterium]|nr:DUF4388 domain-containing protein [Planctomycetota bacterium]
MSFQGDVGGIGLAELLQSLSRGRREGVLRLHTGTGLSANLGLADGVVYFLPDTDEDPVIWKERARQAWIHDQDYRIDLMRMSEIARAHRIDNLYAILDSEGVHFRFEPGGLPRPDAHASGENADAKRMPQVHCEGMPVEIVLLEFARMSDEATGCPELATLTDYVVPRTQSHDAPDQGGRSFLGHCDGQSTLAEIADRLGWTRRQARLTYVDHLRKGHLRPARYHELLTLAQHELAQGHVLRAAARLVGWIQVSPPGPCEEGDAALLAAEFKADRMSALLNRMPAKEARTLLRRLDHAQGDTGQSVKHWRELARLKRSCPITELHRLGTEFRWEDDEEVPSLRELLETARELRDAGHPGRAAAFLRMAASRDPAQAHARMDIGLGMLAAGLVEEGAAWIIDAAQMLIASGAAAKAVGPLRALVDAAPEIREARRLLGRLRHLTVRKQLIRKNSLVGGAILLALGSGAFVRVHMQHDTDSKLAEVSALINSPQAAQSLLDEYFPGDDSERVVALRKDIDARWRFQEAEQRNSWNEAYRTAQQACTLGDPAEGLRMSLDLPAPPRLTTVTEPWPLVIDLFNGLGARLGSEMVALGEVELETPAQIEKESALDARLTAVAAVLAEQGERKDLEKLRERVHGFQDEVHARVKERAQRLEEKQRRDLLSDQDLLLATARSHAEAGDLGRALSYYDELLASDDTGRISRLFEEEIADVRRRFGAVEQARDLARQGRHEEARAVLVENLDDPDDEPLPWKLETFPPGALVELPDGSVRPSPFEVESRYGQEQRFVVRAAGHVTVELVTDAPADQFLWLGRVPERAWKASGRVEALPVTVEGDHVVCDRKGLLARLGPGGETRWQVELGSIGGVARAPVFLPAKPDTLLLLTEDGEAWFVDAASGALEGPVKLGSQPVEGPVASADAVHARTKDGRIATWTTRLKPSFAEGGTLPAGAEHGATSGLAVLQRAEGARREHDSPWTDWSVEITDEVFRVRRGHDDASGFAVQRQGDWTFLAWEAPHAGLPEGRLWISDGGGLAGYTP